MREIVALYAFNRGLVSPLGLARTDQKRVGLSAEIMTNWITRVLGSMALRPGLQYIGGINANQPTKMIPFVFATNDTALIEITPNTMRIWINDVLLTRVSVGTTITNGTFAGSVTGWTDGSDSGGAMTYDPANYMDLMSNEIARAIGYQVLTVATADQLKEHGLHIVIARGPVTFMVGTSLGDDSLISSSSLDTGTYSLSFIPNTASVYVQFISTAAYKVQIQQCTIEAAGVVTISSPYQSADLGKIRYDQSADIVYLACAGYQQRQIERRGTRPGARGWGICLYQVDDGPFRDQNFSPTTITPSALTGDITLTANVPLFKVGQVGALFQVTNQVTGVSAAIVAQNSFTTGLKVTGTGLQRSITVTLTGTWAAVVTLQVSTDDSSWTDVPGEVWNGTVTGPYLDGLDGLTRYYRIGVETGNYTSGTVAASLTYTSGTLAGIARITGYISTTVVNAQVVSDMGSTSATSIWAEQEWSAYRGFPTSVRLHEGRLWWAGQNGVQGSISDSFYSYDPNVLGDAGLIDRTIGSGPVDTINNIVSLQRLILMAQGAEFSIKSSAFDTPLTPTDLTIKAASTQGSAGVDTVRTDQRALYVDRSGIKVFEIVFDLQSYEYTSNDLTNIVPELGLPGIVRMAVQRKPDTRIHCVRSDGTVMLGVIDKVEDVLAWVNVTSAGAGGIIEDVVVLPALVNTTEDQVYYVVNRTISGSTVRYLEKWAVEVNCRGGLLNLQADAFSTYVGPPATAINGLPQLEGQSVVVWADGVDIGTQPDGSQLYAVSSGSVVQRGPNTLSLPGASGSYAYTLNSSMNQITGDIVLIGYIVPNSWRAATIQTIVSKYGGVPTNSYLLTLNTTGALQINTTPDGSTVVAQGSVAAISATTAGSWVAASLQVNDGAGNHIYKFYTSANPPTAEVSTITWTPLGAPIIVAGTTSIFAGSDDLEVGGFRTGLNDPFQGTISSVYVYSGLGATGMGGTLVASFVPNDTTVGDNSWQSALTAEVWNTVGSAAVVLGSIGTGLQQPQQNVVVGLPYEAQWQSAKLGMQASLASSLLTQQKRLSHLGIVAAWFHAKGIQFGPDFDHLNDMPSIERGAPVDPDAIRVAYDEQEFIFPGVWDSDARLCITAAAPRPVTLLAAVVDLEVHN